MYAAYVQTLHGCIILYFRCIRAINTLVAELCISPIDVLQRPCTFPPGDVTQVKGRAVIAEDVRLLLVSLLVPVYLESSDADYVRPISEIVRVRQ